MTVKTFISGFPRIGPNREYKWAVEKYWRGEVSEKELLDIVETQIIDSWNVQKNSSIDKQLIGDFSFYDQALDAIAHLGIPLKRFGRVSLENLDSYFLAARGGDIDGKKEQPLEMTKWFNTNYHYLVPEIDWDSDFIPDAYRFIKENDLARKNNITVIPKILGPATLMTLSKEGDVDENKKTKLVDAYIELFNDFKDLGCTEVMLDEGAVSIGNHFVTQSHFDSLISIAKRSDLDIRLNGYFGSYKGYLDELLESEIEIIHLDLCEGNFLPEEIIKIAERKKVCLGVVNGRSIWRNNLKETLNLLQALNQNRRMLNFHRE